MGGFGGFEGFEATVDRHIMEKEAAQPTTVSIIQEAGEKLSVKEALNSNPESQTATVNVDQLASDPESAPPPSSSSSVKPLERWNQSTGNIFGICGAHLSFLLLGMNDASPGPLIPYLEEYYNLTYTTVSLMFLSPALGYSMAAALNNTIHVKFGQRGIAIIAGTCHLIAFLVLALHPPWPVIVVILVVGGLGNGLVDAAWCAWTGNMVGANKVQGSLQAFYSLGATVAPLAVTSMISSGLSWYVWYYVMVSYLNWLFPLP